MIKATAIRHIPAPPEVVFGVISDRRNHHRIVPGVGGRLVAAGSDGEQGLGAVHRIGLLGRIGVREQVVEYDEPRRFVYTLITSAPLRDHFGEFDLEPVPGGTSLRLTMRTTPLLPVPRRAAEAALGIGLGLFLAGVQRAALRADAEVLVSTVR